MSVVHPNSHVVSTPPASRPRQPAIHAAGLSTRSQPPRRSASSYHPSSSSTANPRFSHLFSTVLGSPFLTTTDIDQGLGPPDPDLDLVDGTAHAVPRTLTITRPSSPASTADFSIIDVDPDDEEARYPYRYAYQGYSSGRPAGHGRSVSSLSTFGKRGTYPLQNPNPGLGSSNTGSTPLKNILPRIWDALSSPARSFTPSPSPPSTPTPSTRYYAYGKGKAPSLDHHVYTPAGYIDYSDLPPLDGEEGELIAIDDEACFIDVTAVTGIDILSLLPPELALHILTLLCTSALSSPNASLTSITPPSSPNPPYSYPRHSIASTHHSIPQEHETAQTALATLLACRSVSRTWRTLASDNTVWRALFLARWGVDLRRAGKGTRERHGRLLALNAKELEFSTPPATPFSNKTLTPTMSPDSPSPRPSPNPSTSMRMRMAMKKRPRMKDIFSPSSSSPASLSCSSTANPFLSLPNSPVHMRSKSVSPVPGKSPTAGRAPMPTRGPGQSRRGVTTPLVILDSPDAHSQSKSKRRSVAGARRSFSMTSTSPKSSSGRPVSSTPTIPVTHAPLKLDWRVLYRERMELDKRWNGTARLLPGLDGSGDSIDTGVGVENGGRVDILDGVGVSGRPPHVTGTGDVWEPRVMRISGHTDSVYCIEFDSTRIITGSRDRTIKVWSLKTGRLLGTFWGAHRGSVLCLKFEGDWERGWDGESEGESEHDGGTGNLIDGTSGPRVEKKLGKEKKREKERKGFMVSGSSDCSVCVWDLTTGRVVGDSLDAGAGCSVQSGLSPDLKGASENGEGASTDEPEREVNAEVRAVLKGHVGGVLDLRIDKRWIVSCSKDAVIRVWDRITLDLHRTLRGHEGPVNAVGLQSEKVVSASGDGKMILWDIESGERLRTFEGHDRGLACIEFKDDLIVSGSNDCKIKLWSASTGECLRTLVGHEALVRALSFDPRSGRLVSASYDKTVKLWDLGSGKMVREFKNLHTSHIFDVRFDVGRIVSTSHDQKIVVLDFAYRLDASLFI